MYKNNRQDLFFYATEYIHDLLDPLKYYNIDLKENFPDFSRYCNTICAKYLYDYLTLPLSQYRDIHIDQLKSMLDITVDYEKFFNYMLKVLIFDKLLTKNGDILTFHPSSIPPLTQSELSEMYPMFRGTVSLLNHCVMNYKEALSGKTPAISILYPEGSSAFLNEKFSLDTEEYTELPIVRNIAVKLLSYLNTKKALNVLEVGGGRGVFTRELFDNTSQLNQMKYHFTDISRRFVIDMQHYVSNKGLHFVTCSQFDITKNPTDQGIDISSYDIVIGVDVVHATPNIEITLKNLKSLLNDQGILLLLETTRAYRWQNLIMGLTKGWWLFNDKWRTYSPLISPCHWRKAIETCGFIQTNITTLQNVNSDAALILAAP